jgi:hypothetical protein
VAAGLRVPQLPVPGTPMPSIVLASLVAVAALGLGIALGRRRTATDRG